MDEFERLMLLTFFGSIIFLMARMIFDLLMDKQKLTIKLIEVEFYNKGWAECANGQSEHAPRAIRDVVDTVKPRRSFRIRNSQ